MPAGLADVVAALDARFPAAWAADWDAVGLVVGRPEAPIRRLHFAVDPVEAVLDEALAAGADLLVTHHPLFLRAVHGVPATTAKGRLVHRLVESGVALYVAHTNADVAAPGVSDALASAVGLSGVGPIGGGDDQGGNGGELVKLVTFVPHADADRVIDALAGAGAGEIGEYRRCAWTTAGSGTFRPTDAARPAIGQPGRVEVVPETRLEMVLPAERRAAALAALRSAHPYEEPAVDLFPLAAAPSGRGLGRIGELAEARTLRAFTAGVAAALPVTCWGVRAAGDPDRPVRRVAVCGGSGGELAAAAAADGAEVLLTADLRHHAASDALADTGLCLVDAAHWATEAPWLAQAADALVADLADTVSATVSTVPTDPWTVSERA